MIQLTGFLWQESTDALFRHAYPNKSILPVGHVFSFANSFANFETLVSLLPGSYSFTLAIDTTA
ncbi:MAG: hypothetical protein RLZZ28_1913 [Bacteroidota bacterium]|jgi:hypothetical protein